MGSSETNAEKLVSDYFNHGRNTSPDSWHSRQVVEMNKHTVHKQEAQHSLQGKGDSHGD